MPQITIYSFQTFGYQEKNEFSMPQITIYFFQTFGYQEKIELFQLFDKKIDKSNIKIITSN
jgi:hypothetical protein